MYEWVTSHINESCHKWMSHVTYEWDVSYMKVSHRIWMGHVTYEWGMSHMNESCHIWMSHVTYEWFVSLMKESCLIWMSHVTYAGAISCMNELCHIWKKCVISCRTWMRHVTHEWVVSHMNESCHVWVFLQLTFVEHMNESCHTWMGHVTHELCSCMNGSCHAWMSLVQTNKSKISQVQIREVKRTNATDLPKCTLSVYSSLEFAVEKNSMLQFPLKMLHLWNTPNRKTQIPRYLAAQIQIEKCSKFKLTSGLIWICNEEFEFLHF